jgi:ACR3 family arsenite efflux pump ArsB
MFFKKNLMKLVPITIVTALLVGYFGNTVFLKQYVTAVLFFMIFPMMINMNVLDVFKTFTAPKKIIIATVINFIVSPLLAIGLSKVFFSNYPSLTIALVIISVLPTSGMTASWTGLSGGNLKLSLAIMSTNLLLSILVLPFYLGMINTGSITIETGIVVQSLLKIVILPLILGDLTRRLIIKFYKPSGYKKVKPYFGEVSSFFVLIIIFIAVSLKSKMILNNVSLALYAVIPLTLYYLILLSVSHFTGKALHDKKDHIALVFSTTMRNLTIALGIAMGIEGGDLAVFLMALAYMVQLPFATLYHNYAIKKLITK